VTSIPVAQSVDVIKRLRAAEPRSMAGMPPVLWNEAQGFLVRDPYGNQWIDLTSGIVVANVGHAHPRIVKALREAIGQNLLATYAFPARTRLELLEKLIALSPAPNAKALLFSSGTEATECAIMLMRLHGQSCSSRKTGIIGFDQCYHGRTLGAKLAGGKGHPGEWIKREAVHHYQAAFPFDPRLGEDDPDYQPGCFKNIVSDLEARGIGPEDIAGIILEPTPGSTTRTLPAEFLHDMQSWAKENNILTTYDEIQSGCGRTGNFFSFEHANVVPDFVALGKGLSSSLPVSAILGPGRLMDVPAPGEMSSTHGGNPVCVAAALANLEIIEDEGLVEQSAATGLLVKRELEKLVQEFPGHFRCVNGRGLFVSLHFKKPGDGQPDIELADAVALEAVRRGVMMFVTGRGYLKFTPPLNILPEAALEAVRVVRDSFIHLK